MEHIHFSKKPSVTDTQCQYKVLPIGFDTAFIERIKNIFKLERPANRTYSVVHSESNARINVLLVNHDDSLALHKKISLLNTTCPHAWVVYVSQGPLATQPEYHIRGMMTASRLLSVLDRLPTLPTDTSESLTTGLNLVDTKPETLHAAIPAAQTVEPTVAAADFYKQASQAVIPHYKDTAPATVVVDKPTTPNPTVTNSYPSGYRALVVDDSTAIQMALKLKLRGIEQITTIDFADSGESALEKATAMQYDLIFLDVMMPGMDGYEACSRLRKMPEYKKTPIIMVSGKTSPLDEVKGVMAGCTTYLTKPVNDQAFHKLSLRVLNWLADRKSVATTQ
jgi:two-component system, cell cycle response regulator